MKLTAVLKVGPGEERHTCLSGDIGVISQSSIHLQEHKNKGNFKYRVLRQFIYGFVIFILHYSLKWQFLCILVCKCSFKHLLKSLRSHPNCSNKSACAADWHFCGRSVQYFGPSGVCAPVRRSGH